MPRALLLITLAAACSKPVAPAAPGAPPVAVAVATVAVDLGPFQMSIPATWTAKPVSSSMRAATYVLSPDTELIIFYFGPEGVGSVEANHDRWLTQFTQPDGRPSKSAARYERLVIGGHEAILVSITGTYAVTMGGAAPALKPDQAMRAVIVESPSGPYYFKVVGARATVEQQDRAIRNMLGSLVIRTAP